MEEERMVELSARYDADTKRTHRFLIESAEGVNGTIYVSKESRPLPKRVVIQLKVKEKELWKGKITISATVPGVGGPTGTSTTGAIMPSCATAARRFG
jgi:hypothetical protein